MKKVSIKKLCKEYSANNVEIMTLNVFDEPIEIEVKHYLQLADVAEFVNTIVDIGAPYDENGVVSYKPFFRDVANVYATMKFFTNIDYDIKPEKLYEIFHATGACEEIAKVIGWKYYCEVMEYADRMIQYRLDHNESTIMFAEILISIKKMIPEIKSLLDGLDADTILKWVDEQYPGGVEALAKAVSSDEETKE